MGNQDDITLGHHLGSIEAFMFPSFGFYSALVPSNWRAPSFQVLAMDQSRTGVPWTESGTATPMQPRTRRALPPEQTWCSRCNKVIARDKQFGVAEHCGICTQNKSRAWLRPNWYYSPSPPRKRQKDDKSDKSGKSDKPDKSDSATS